MTDRRAGQQGNQTAGMGSTGFAGQDKRGGSSKVERHRPGQAPAWAPEGDDGSSSDDGGGGGGGRPLPGGRRRRAPVEAAVLRRKGGGSSSDDDSDAAPARRAAGPRLPP